MTSHLTFLDALNIVLLYVCIALWMGVIIALVVIASRVILKRIAIREWVRALDRKKDAK